MPRIERMISNALPTFDRTTDMWGVLVEANIGEVTFILTWGNIHEVDTEAMILPKDAFEDESIRKLLVNNNFRDNGKLIPSEAFQVVNDPLALGKGLPQNGDHYIEANFGTFLALAPTRLRKAKVLWVGVELDENEQINEDEMTVRALAETFSEADRYGVRSIAIPPLAGSIFVEQPAKALHNTLKGWEYYADRVSNSSIETIKFVVPKYYTAKSGYGVYEVLDKYAGQ